MRGLFWLPTVVVTPDTEEPVGEESCGAGRGLDITGACTVNKCFVVARGAARTAGSAGAGAATTDGARDWAAAGTTGGCATRWGKVGRTTGAGVGATGTTTAFFTAVTPAVVLVVGR